MSIEITYSFWELLLASAVFGGAIGFVRGFVYAMEDDRRERKRLRKIKDQLGEP